jgi:hypothetical protein
VLGIALGIPRGIQRRIPLAIPLRIALAIGLALAGFPLFAQAAPPGSANSSPAGAGAATVKQLGSIREIHGSGLLLATDQGQEISVQVQSGARLLRLPPGQTDLKNATPIQLADLQVGDRALVRGTLGADGKSLNAASVVVIKQQDIARRQSDEMLDWGRRGIAGLVQKIDLQAGTVTISTSGASVVVSVTPRTTYKRYAPDSVKWEEAAASRFDEIHPGDQLRAKGNRNPGATQMEAEEIVFGTFRSISGLVTAIDAAHGTLTVELLATNTRRQVKMQITADSQMRKLPPETAARLAALLKARAAQDGTPSSEEANPARSGPPGGGMRTRSADLNHMLARLPAVAIGDLHNGEAVMIVSTVGSAGKLPAVITLVDGVEPILAANATGQSAESLLTPWSLASAPGGD